MGEPVVVQHGLEGVSCLRDADRRARSRRRRAPLPRRRHRRTRRSLRLRPCVGPAGRRLVRSRAAARRAVPHSRPLGRHPCRCAERAGDAGSVLGPRSVARHRRCAGPRRPRPRIGDGAVVRRPIGPRSRPGDGAAEAHRRSCHHHRAVHAPLAGRTGPGPREGGRRLLGLCSRARHERIDVHRAGHRLDRRRRCRSVVGRGRRAVGPAARRCAVARAADARRGREGRRRRALGQAGDGPRRPTDGLRSPRATAPRIPAPACSVAPPKS